MESLSPSPFLLDAARPEVHLRFGEDGYSLARELLAQFPLSRLAGAKVLLKPNAGRVAAAGTGTNTSPQVVAAAIDAFREAGAIVSVGDSPIAGVRAGEALEVSGIAAVVRKHGATLLDFDERPPTLVALPHGIAIDSLKVCAAVFEHDFVVSIPVVKTHMHTGVTLSIKNMKGCLWRRSKVTLHMLGPVAGRSDRPLDLAIADVASILRPHLALVDGTEGMEGLGPSAGKVKRLGALVASADPFAADAVTCALMGIRAETIPHLRLGAELGYGIIDLERLRITPEDWASHADPFAEPPRDLSLYMPKLRVLDQNSCSACQSTLLMFVKRYGTDLFDYLPGPKPTQVAIGKGHVSVDPGTLCLGNCTLPHRATGVFVPGCPPVASTIHKVLTQGLGKVTSDEGER